MSSRLSDVGVFEKRFGGCRSPKDPYKIMKKLIYVLVPMLLGSAVSVPFAMVRDANRDASHHILTERQRQEQRWEAVVHSTGAARQ
jgi:hypothetical protein